MKPNQDGEEKHKKETLEKKNLKSTYVYVEMNINPQHLDTNSGILEHW